MNPKLKIELYYFFRYLHVRLFWRWVARLKTIRAFFSSKEYITGVAIIVKSGELFELPRPYRHHHCNKQAFKKYGEQVICLSQGFITSTGRYVDRREALGIAIRAKQLLPMHHHQYELFSESVW